jgi:hypothetical protein
MNRKKRLEKGISSIEEEIKYHKEKQEQSKEQGNFELSEYYDKEIKGLEKTKERKENQFENY